MSPTRDVGAHYGLTCERAAEEVIAPNHYMQKPKEAAGWNDVATVQNSSQLKRTQVTQKNHQKLMLLPLKVFYPHGYATSSQ